MDVIGNVSAKVSIIIPVYNAEDFLDRCITSCQLQTYKNLEIILVDDGSTDASATIAKGYGLLDNRVKYYRKPNSGVSDARNMGISQATGEFLLFLDADDSLQPDCCARLLEAMSEDVDMVVCGYDTGNEPFLPQEKVYGKDDFFELIQDLASCNSLYVCWNKLYRKEKMTKPFPSGITFAEDSMFVFGYLSACSNVVTLSYGGYRYTVTENTGSAMKKYHPKMLEMCLKEAETIEDALPGSVALTEFAQNHLIQNLLYFILPNLFADPSIGFWKRYKHVAKLSMTPEIHPALASYVPTRRMHRLLKRAMLRRHTILVFLISWFVYGRAL